MSEGAGGEGDGGSGERMARELADAVGQSRERTAADASDPGVPVAGTAVLVRDGAFGPEILMIERPDRGSFAGAWVFPGGKLEPADAEQGATEEDDARRAAARETREETGLEVAEHDLATLSCWDPPPGIRVRIRTWFFLARAPEGEPELSPDEAVAATWATAGDILARHGRGELTLYPPTWVTLHGLLGAHDVDALLGRLSARAAGLAEAERFETVVRQTPAGPLFLWQGDAAYAEAAQDAASGARHRLETGTLPWRYERADGG
jgi:8-oxo-dGTP pyrophosphatase MutT (NUDIX family)